MKDQINAILEALIESTKQIVDFGKAEIPILLREILTFEATKWGILFVSIQIGVFLIYKATRTLKGEERALIFVFMFMVEIVGLYFLINLTQALIAPRLYLLEYLKSFL